MTNYITLDQLPTILSVNNNDLFILISDSKVYKINQLDIKTIILDVIKNNVIKTSDIENIPDASYISYNINFILNYLNTLQTKINYLSNSTITLKQDADNFDAINLLSNILTLSAGFNDISSDYSKLSTNILNTSNNILSANDILLSLILSSDDILEQTTNTQNSILSNINSTNIIVNKTSVEYELSSNYLSALIDTVSVDILNIASEKMLDISIYNFENLAQVTIPKINAILDTITEISSDILDNFKNI